MVQDEPTAMADAVAARDVVAGLIEYRIDEFFSGTRDAGESGATEGDGMAKVPRGW